MTREHRSKFVGVSIEGVAADESNSDDFGIESNETEEIEMTNVRIQVLENLEMGREIDVVPIWPRKIGELVIGTKRLKLSRSVRTVLPNAADAIRRLENNWPVVGQLLGGSDAANSGADNGDFGENWRH